MPEFRTAPDAAARAHALNPERSFLVQAPAGSGKTELLIQRYLVLLARVDEPESVIAITFTRKAAAEMRRRVLDALERAAGPAPSQPHAAQTHAMARAVCERDAQRGWRLAENPGRLAIRTIDSLCSALTSRMPWLSRLGAPPEVVEDASELYTEGARRTIAMLEGDDYGAYLERILLHLDNDFGALEALIAAMLSRRDQWLRHIAGVDPAGARPILEQALTNAIAAGLARARRAVPEELSAEITELASYAGGNVEPVSPIACCEGMGDLPGTDPDDLDRWCGIASLLLTNGGDLRKPGGVNKKIGFPPGTSEKQRILELLDDLAGEMNFCAAFNSLRTLPPPRYDDRQWEVLEALVPVLNAAAAQLALVFRDRGQVDFTEMAISANRALGNDDAPTDLALALDCRIQHLLIDEFQDTSVTQFELIRKLTAGWEPGDGRTLFAVGDPMQSIYRFREAEVGLFLRAARDGVGQLPLERVQLTANFRSKAGIVEWVNRTFPDVLAPADDLGTGAVRFARSEAVHDAGYEPAVQVYPLLTKDDAVEAARVVSIVRTARERSQSDTVAILVRAKTHAASILAALRSANVPYRAVDMDDLGEVPVTQDLLALTRALLNPADRVSWLAVLRAPWCGLTLADLHALAAGDAKASIWDLMQDEARVNRLGNDGRARLLRVREAFDSALAHRGPSLSRWIEGCWVALGGPACSTRPGELENTQAFLSLLEAEETGGDVDLDTLVERTSKLFAAPDPRAGETLQVMSMHKAKGLQFDVVILPGLDRYVRGDSPRLLAWLERPGEDGQDLLLAPVKAVGADEDPLYKYVQCIERAKNEHEAERLLYVAATRARKELHLVGRAELDAERQAVKPPDGRSLLRKLWPALRSAFDEEAARQAPTAEPANGGLKITPLLRRLESGWTRPEPPAAVAAEVSAPMVEHQTEVTFEWVGDTLRHIGTAVHAALEQIARDGLAAWDEAKVLARRPAFETALRTLGVPTAGLASAADAVERALLRTLADPRGRWVLDGSHEDAESEYALNGIVNGRVVSTRIDRTFVADGVRWVVDFKTSTHEGAGVEAFLDNERERYREQMSRYAELISRIDPRPIRMALYFPLLGAWREYTELPSRARQGAFWF